LDPALPSASLSGVPEGPPKPKPTEFPRLPPPPAKPTNEPNELGFDEDDCAVPKRLDELAGLSLPKRVLVDGAELPTAVVLKLNVEDEPKGEVPEMEVPNNVLEPVVVTGGAKLPDEVPDVESGDGKENPDNDVNGEAFGSVVSVVVDEFEPNEPKSENAGGACVDDGFESGAADTDDTLVEVDGLASNSV
jgi:hypothetical protein